MFKLTQIQYSLPGAITARLDEARDQVFLAHSIAAVAAAAAVSTMPADEHCTEATLTHLSTMLDQIAAMIEPAHLARREPTRESEPEAPMGGVAS